MMDLTRRNFLGIAVTGAAGAVIANCTGKKDAGKAALANGPSSLSVPTGLVLLPNIVDGTVRTVDARWGAVRDAQSYDVEVNGFVVADGSHGPQFELGSGDGRTGLCVGTSAVRVRARAGALEGPWSDPQTFTILPSNVVRVRGFDLEDDGDIRLTVAKNEAAGNAALRVGSAYAYGGKGKGVALVCTDGNSTKAYKNHDMLPIEETWIRLSFSPQKSSEPDKRIQLARITDSSGSASERLLWVTGKGVTSSSMKSQLPVAEKSWVQLQLGVDKDGKVELWAYDGTRETLVGTALSKLAGPHKDSVSIGSADAKLGVTFEAWMDDFAVGTTRLPWTNPGDARSVRQLQRLDPTTLPSTFTFVFGSCSNSNHVPATGTALAAAAAADPTFVLHLGDLGYVDSSAYAQSAGGYISSWNDLLGTDHMGKLAARPWVRIVSDHDMGGNNVTAATLAPFAADAFAKFNVNDTSADPAGRYGSMTLDNGRILLVWTEGVLWRSALNDPNAPGNTKLGAQQKAWLMQLLASSKAKLIILASETSMGRQTSSSWTCHPAERLEVIKALKATGAHVRVLSGDLHHASWQRLTDKVAEWGAAAMSEFPESDARPAKDVLEATGAGYKGFGSRPLALLGMSIPDFNSTTTYGHATIDTHAGTASFELRRFDGSVWLDANGRPMSETFTYA